MEYDLFNNYEDKINYLKNQNLLIDELGLTGRIPKLNVRDSATENSNKINILREMWNGYKSPLFSAQTGRDLLATHLLWKTNLMRRLKSEALSCGVTNFDADLVVGTKYTKDTNPINASGLKTYLMDPHSISSLYLVEFTSPIELKNHAASLVAKGLVSGNLNVFLTCQKVIFFGLEYGLTKRNVANFLLQILERDVEQVTDTRGQALQEPDVRRRRGQVDVPQALTTHLGLDHLNTTLLADHTAVLHALILAADALVVFDRTEDLGAEEAVALRLKGAVVDRLGLFNFAVTPLADLLRAGDSNPDRAEA